MTIGKNSRRTSTRSSIRAPKFLDKSNGFYGRLDDDGHTKMQEGLDTDQECVHGREEKLYDCAIEDDCETLLHRKPSRLSSRWRRSTRRKQREEEEEEEREDQLQHRDKRPSLSTESTMDTLEKKVEEDESVEVIVHFQVREDSDDQVLIRDQQEREEEEKVKKEQDRVRAVKKNSVKNYRKALDRAFRRGWETFITNLYSVTLTPVTSSSSSPSPSSDKIPQQDCQ